MALDFSEAGFSFFALSGIIPLISVLVIIPLLVQLDKKKHLSAIPNSRSSHRHTVSSIGGIGIFVSVAIGTLPTIFSTSIGQDLSMLFLGFILLFLLGIKDDIFDSSPYFKLVVQLIVSLIIVQGTGLLISNLYGFLGIYEIAREISIVLSVLLIITIINSVNFIDGIDGLATMIGIVGYSISALIFYQYNEIFYFALAVSLICALFGFLRFNLSKKSKVFMGDTGSLLIGLALSIFLLKIWGLHGKTSSLPAIPYWVLSLVLIPVFDFVRVFLIRISNGKSPMKADRNHVHHILVDHCSFSHIKASMFLSFLSFIFIFLSYVIGHSSSILLIMLWYVSIFMLYITTLHQLQKMALHTASLNHYNEEILHKALLKSDLKAFSLVYKTILKKDRHKKNYVAEHE
jgi:UDP-GlcNAc:undecaprenyl-phosphate/decaprenyl-phosphate GlcNAc-1-phosphate transferase